MLKLPARYEHRRLLGSGGMGEVHLVFDREREEEVALKTFSPAPGADEAEGRFLFKQEFWAMASFRHPHLVAAYDYGELEDGTPYLTMELVPGHDLAEGRQAEHEVRAWLPGVAAALAYLHGRGYVHGDLKPENIRLREDGCPKLMDLGLLTRSGRTGGAIRGSLHYMAPEAIRQGAVDGRTDLYGLGAVVYHLLAGRPPFEGDNPVVLLRAHLEQAPEPLRALAPEVSRELESAVMRLLAKEPQARFAGAGELLASLGLEAEGVDEVGLLGSPVVGREAAQEALARRSPGTTWLVGGSGAGKTRLLTEARAEAQLAGAKTLFAQGLGAGAPPYEALKPWLRALSVPGAAFDRVAPVLARVLPEIGVAPAPALEGVQERVRLHAAVAELAIAGVEAGVFYLDDADALDPSSQELMQFLARQEGRAWSFVLAGQAAPEGAAAIALDPLPEPQALELARALLGQDALPAALTDRLHVLTGGMPGPIEAVLGHWLRTGALRREAGSWVAGPDEAFELPGGLSVALDSRFAALSEEARRVGRAAAILGATGELRMLASLVDMAEGAFFAAVAELEGAEVLAKDGQSFRFTRPAQAQALAAGFAEDEARALHGRAAAFQLAQLGADAHDPAHPLGAVLAVAHHLLAGPAPLSAAPWVESAVKRSMGLYAVSQAEPLLRRAMALSGLGDGERLRLTGLLANVLRFQGQIDESLALYEETILPAARQQEAPELAEHLVTYGILQQLKGQYQPALEAFAAAINRADATQDIYSGVRARLYAGRVAFFAGETGAAKTHLASAVRRAEEAGLTTLLAGGLSLYGYVLASTEPGKVAEGLAALERAFKLNSEIGDLGEAHEALNNRGNILMAAGRVAEAKETFLECLAICERMATPNETIFAHLNLGAVMLELGALEPAREHGHKAAEMSRKQGRKFPEGFSLALEGLAMVYRGELATGVERLARGLALAREIANKYLELNVLVYWVEALVFLGRWEEAEAALQKARALVEATHNDEHNAKFDRLEAAMGVARGREEAAARLAELADAAREKKQTVALAYALRWQAEWLLGKGEAESAAGLLTEAMALAGEAGLQALMAEIALLHGHSAERRDLHTVAAERYAKSLELARETGHVLAELEAQAGLGQVLPTERKARREAKQRLTALIAGLEDAERAAFLAWPARAAFMEDGGAVEGGIATERLHHLADLMAAVSAELDLEAVMAQALAAFVEIAGADRGFLLLYSGFEVTQQIFHGMGEDESDAFSSSLAYQVLWNGEPLFVEDAQSHAELGMQKSIQALSLRSVVGLPIKEGSETIGVMLADSRRINTRFGEAELELAMLLARQVGIAITNARRLARYKNGYEELAVLHRLALATAGAPDLAGFLAPVAAEAALLCQAERVFLLEGEGLACTAAFDAEGRALSLESRDLSQSVSRWVFENGEPLHLLDAQSDESFQAQKSVMALGLRTVFAVPVAYAGTRFGVLYMDNQRVVEADPAALHTLNRIGEMVGAFLHRRV